ncbi:MAG TPA: CaiB/BaiF CoA-transferase family protein [Burkholderiales bacterium]|nr:CaiB/BaiF CoA-transferase family protein [Burkholderiales bacterium]
MQPLSGIRVIDFSTLLPGPMATLLLAEAGAEVIKIERPESGEELRHYLPRFGDASVPFAMLNRGKRSIALDLKCDDAVAQLTPLLASADVLVEQFRPGVMQRLGLGYEAVKALNARIVYCSITGYGQDGPKAQVAGHDLNYQGDAGLLSLAAGADGAPVVPSALIADIAGGAYPAVMNILLALRQRDETGEGCYLDVAMTDGLLPFLYWGIGNGATTGHWPRPGGELLTGGSPRYQIYRTADGRFLAAAPLEDKFWANFCAAIELPQPLRDDRRDPMATIHAVRETIGRASAAEWMQRFEGKDVCCTVVRSVDEALRDPQFRARGVFRRSVISEQHDGLPAISVPIAEVFRDSRTELKYPELAEGQALLDSKASG